ncbi:hypothetical protein [Mesorhizobium sp.]|uniref:hypothetical protein n=1 Tax=Mesorhizobium sp. TaxID=1871066 RepID=UPI0025B7CFA3|nr:hypothetical protein [Mesorhizobium sp.]
MNERHIHMTNAALDKLPLFASDKEIALAIVGREKAQYWLTGVLPTLERRGFPAEDPLHTGRAVPLVRKFYEQYLGITAGFAMAKPDSEERIWTPKRERKRIEAEERRIAEANVQRRDRRAEAKANSEAWKEKKRKALEDFRAKKASQWVLPAADPTDRRPDES